MVERHEPVGEIVLYQTPDGHARVECRFADETLWLSQALIAELFEITVPTVSEHLKGIYAEGELGPGGTIRRFRTVRQEGARQVAREIEHYNLDAILAAGYRICSPVPAVPSHEQKTSSVLTRSEQRNSIRAIHRFGFSSVFHPKSCFAPAS